MKFKYLMFVFCFLISMNFVFCINYFNQTNYENIKYFQINFNQTLNYKNYDLKIENQIYDQIYILNSSLNLENNFKNNNFKDLEKFDLFKDNFSFFYVIIKDSFSDKYLVYNLILNQNNSLKNYLEFILENKKNKSDKIFFKNSFYKNIINKKILKTNKISQKNFSLKLENQIQNKNRNEKKNKYEKEKKQIKIDKIKNNSNKCNCSNLIFDINLINNYNKKIEFFFNANLKNSNQNLDNFIISYWIEDFDSNVLKSKKNTTNFNKKVFTPKYFGQYILKAKIYYKNCSKSILKDINFNQNYSQIPNKIKFKINSNFKIGDEKIKYYFDTNLDNFTISYWIEDFQKNIIKEKVLTNNKNLKTYSPKKFSNIYIINAKINGKFENKTFQKTDKKQIFYYFKKENLNQTQNQEQINQENLNKNSYIKIKNKNQLLNSKTSILEYEIYKNKNRKKVVYFYLNSKKIFSINVPKFEIIQGKISLPLNIGKNILYIKGIDLEEDLTFFYEKNLSFKKINSNTDTNQNQNQNENENINLESLENNLGNFPSKNFQILDFQIKNNSNKINFKINTKVNVSNILCYVNLIRTKISSIFKINLSSKKDLEKLKNISLILNLSKIKSKNANLKLICKYKKINKNYYIYENYNFNYIKNQRNFSLKLKNNSLNLVFYENNLKMLNSIKNQNLENKNNILKKTNTYQNQNINLKNQKNNLENLKQNKTIIYKSKNQKIKEIFPKYLYLILIFITSFMIIFW